MEQAVECFHKGWGVSTVVGMNLVEKKKSVPDCLN
jgi:hypothetical protein